MSIDFVVTWVDSSDENWNSKKNKYKVEGQCDDRDVRYSDWELLRYWFRGVEKFATWVGKVYFVTDEQIPQWLNVNNPKLVIVNHSDYIDKSYLPTFNSTVIENHIYKIKGLSEQFVYFNDDLYLLQNAKPEDFFVNGKPCDMVAFQPIIANPQNPVMSYHFLNNSVILAKHFKKRECVKKNPAKYFKLGYPIKYLIYNFLELAFPQFTGMYTVHGPSPFLKSTFNEVWEKEYEALSEASKNKFRCKTDVNQYLFREWQKLSGNFCPKNVHRFLDYFEISDNNDMLCKSISRQSKKFICINDCEDIKDKERVMLELQQAFESILPEKSSFEI